MTIERQNIYDNPTWISSYSTGWERASSPLLGYRREALVQAEPGYGYTVMDLGKDIRRSAQHALHHIVKIIQSIDQSDIMQVQQLKRL